MDKIHYMDQIYLGKVLSKTREKGWGLYTDTHRIKSPEEIYPYTRLELHPIEVSDVVYPRIGNIQFHSISFGLSIAGLGPSEVSLFNKHCGTIREITSDQFLSLLDGLNDPNIKPQELAKVVASISRPPVMNIVFLTFKVLHHGKLRCIQTDKIVKQGTTERHRRAHAAMV